MDLRNLPKVPFRILSFSSEDTSYPVTELLRQSPQSLGWQSQRFCDFPQEIILELNYPTRVQYIQFLSHQCKISSKVEIFACLPKDAHLKAGVDYAVHPADLKFAKVGYFFFNSNEANNFERRELKTVVLGETKALYVKVVMHKCHVNQKNIYNQIGVIAMSVYGEAIPTNGVVKIPTEPQAGFQELEFNMQFDEETLNRLRMLQKARDRAEKNEDYTEAKKLNDAITDLKRVGINLQKLEERKAIAVRNKDYDSAQILKQEIDSLRRAKFSDAIPYLNQEKPSVGGGGLGRPGPGGQQGGRGKAFDTGIDLPEGGFSKPGGGVSSNDRRSPVDNNRRANLGRETNADGFDDETIPASKPSNPRGGTGSPGRNNVPGGYGSRANVQQPVNPDSIVIPTHKNKQGANQMGMGGIDEDQMQNRN